MPRNTPLDNLTSLAQESAADMSGTEGCSAVRRLINERLKAMHNSQHCAVR